MDQITRAAFSCAALVLTLAFLLGISSFLMRPAGNAPRPGKNREEFPNSPSAEPTGVQDAPNDLQNSGNVSQISSKTPPSSSETNQTSSIIFLGTTSDPFCAPLYSSLEDYCAGSESRLTSYDCKGNAKNQIGQIEDVIRTETPDIVIIYSILNRETLDEWVEKLYRISPVITVGNSPSPSAARYVSGFVEVDFSEKIETICAYLRENKLEKNGIFFLLNAPDSESETRLEGAFTEEKVEILTKKHIWNDISLAKDQTLTVLETYPSLSAILCDSPTALEGSREALEDKGLRGQVKLIALDFDPSLSDALALGEIDAVPAVFLEETEEILTKTIKTVLEGKRSGQVLLPLRLLTPETAGSASEYH